jgi:PAS domain S-box-containing protein
MIDRPGLTGVLHELNDEARVLVQNSPDIMLRLNLDGTIGWVNPAWTRWLRYEPAEVKDQPFINFVHPDDLDLLSKAVRQLRHEDLTQRTRFRMLIKAGGELVVGARGTYFNGLGRAYLVLREQSMSLAYEQRILALEKRWRAVMENAMDGVALLDAGFKVLYESPAIKDILGYDPAQREGRSGFELIHPDDLATLRAQIAGLLKRPGEATYIHPRVRRADGKYVKIEARLKNLLDDPDVRAIVANYRSDQWTQPGGLTNGGGDE